MDSIDRSILKSLREDGRRSAAAIAREVGLTPAAVGARLSKLRDAGVLRGFRAHFDPRALGFEVLAYVFVVDNDPSHRDETARHLADLACVESVSKITGEDTFMVEVWARDTADLARILDQEIGSVESIQSTRTCVVMGPVLEGRWPDLASSD